MASAGHDAARWRAADGTARAETLRGRTGVVTGAGRGIGRAIAEELAARGMALALIARTGDQVRTAAEELASRYDVPVFPAAVDVTDAAAVERTVQHVEQKLGTVDLLVNNAATIESREVPFWESDIDDVWRVVETNLRGPLLMTRALLPPMVQRGHGRVVTIASQARAATRTGTYTGYALSKRALSLLTESLTEPLRGTGIVVLDVLPGLVRTDLTLSMPTWADVTEWDSAEAVARVVADAAQGRYDDRHGGCLDAPALASR